uniref:Ig-like domain-containing protein n=1 Tax=Prolemur simus TaxID=1328070 RepID=A0A8C9DHG3_PROSS
FKKCFLKSISSCKISFLLSRLPYLSLLNTQTLMSGFSVKGPAEPIVALLGEDATLPCQLSPEQSAAHMDIRWYRAQLSPAVLVFQNRQDPGGEQMLEYRGRAQLIQVRASDDGQYGCRFQDGDLFREAVVQLHVVEPFFLRVSPWKAALAGALPVLGLLLTQLSCIGWREYKAKKREIKKRNKESHERDQMRSKKEMALETKGRLGSRADQRFVGSWRYQLCKVDGEIKGAKGPQGKHRV